MPKIVMQPGDTVMRRPGTLGATGKLGTVTAVEERGGLVTVKFADRVECFVASTYVDATKRPRRTVSGIAQRSRIVCEGCGQNIVEKKGNLCPGCDAYRDHQS